VIIIVFEELNNGDSLDWSEPKLENIQKLSDKTMVIEVTLTA